MKTAWEGIVALATGFATTFKHLFRKPITEEYPEYKRALPERARAVIVLTRDPDGEERCVACYLCSAACPVSCISMQSAEREDGRRYARWFRINFARCIYCGLCEEACPTSAIQLTPYFETCERSESPSLILASVNGWAEGPGNSLANDFLTMPPRETVKM